MNNQSKIDSSEKLSLIQQGDAETIAAQLNTIFSHQGIRAKVALKNAYLGILLEGVEIPDRQAVMAVIQQQTQEFASESIKAIRIYGRQVGQVTPQWCEEIEFKQPARSNNSLLSLTDWLSQGMEAVADNFELPKSSAEGDVQKFLRFHFSSDSTALLPLNTIKEVLNISSSKIHPVPHTADCLLGIYDYRGEILWLTDLGQQLGLTPSIDSLNFSSSEFPFSSMGGIASNSTDTLTAIVIQNKEKCLGIVVPKVIDIEMHDLQEMLPASEELFSRQISPFLQGYLIRSSSPVLDPHALIEDSQLQNIAV